MRDGDEHRNRAGAEHGMVLFIRIPQGKEADLSTGKGKGLES